QQVAAEMAPFLFEHFGNPSSGHTYGRVCKAALDTARQRVGRLLNAADPAAEVCFTSCGTESDNWALYGAVALYRRRQLLQLQQGGAAGAAAAGALPHVVASEVEHPAVLVHLQHLRDQ
ncbi:Cysteine desulfurase, partial [Tetrabaena socialis]